MEIEDGLASQVVAPLAGAWIEIFLTFFEKIYIIVAPLAGAWIEMTLHMQKRITFAVAPLAGAWIEILFILSILFQ